MKWMISICLIVIIAILFSIKKDMEYLKKCKWYRIAKEKTSAQDRLECDLDGLGCSPLRVLNSHACCGYTGNKGGLCKNCPMRDGIILSEERMVVK